MNKAKKRAKAKRRELRERIQVEQQGAKIRKKEKAERNRRFFNGERKDSLPEDRIVLNSEAFDFEEFRVLVELHTRCFFMKLGETLSKKECTDNHVASIELFKQMNIKEEKQQEIVAIFEKYGGYCDCEVMYNVLSKLHDTPVSLEDSEFYY